MTLDSFNPGDHYDKVIPIACGDVVHEKLHLHTSARARFRAPSLAENMCYRARTARFRTNDTIEVLRITVTSEAFTPVITLRRDATKDKIFPGTNGKVEIKVTDELIGPFLLEVSSLEKYAEGDFIIYVDCLNQPPAANYQLWSLTNTDSSNHAYLGSAGSWPPSAFTIPSPATVVSAVKARSWSDDCANPNPIYWQFPYYSCTAVEVPVFYPPWSWWFQPVCNVNNGWFWPIGDAAGLHTEGLYDLIWAGTWQSPGAAYAGPCSLWFYHPSYREVGGSPSTYWQNILAACRSQYRIDGTVACAWEASCELWIQIQRPGATPMDPPLPYEFGWGGHPYEASPGSMDYYYRHRVYPRNFVFKRMFTPTIFTAGLSDPTNTTDGWNEIVLPDAGDSFYSTTSTNGGGALDGFLGRLIFHVLNETPNAWQTRTGCTLSGL